MADRLFKAAARAGTAANFREVLKKCDTVKRSKIVVAALSDGFFTSDWCAAEIVAAKQAGIKVIPVFSGNDHAANQVDKWVKAYKDHPEFGYVFRENARDVLNKQNPTSVKATLEYLSKLA